MKKYVYYVLLLFCTGVYFSCKAELMPNEKGDMKISIEEGAEWLHNFPLFMGIKVKNPPQIAIWIEDREGNYLSTIFVTKRTATGNWRMAKGNRRKESLPHWSYQRGIQAEDGLYLPTRNEPLTDGITGASPRKSFNVIKPSLEVPEQFVIKVEINHSTDFNEAFPKQAVEGEPNYSGGSEGSGQPALIYVVLINRSSTAREFEATLMGHSSPDGTDGKIYSDLSGITTALHIVKKITVSFPEENN